MYQTSIGETSTRHAAIDCESGDHQYPRNRPISSAAMNSALPQEIASFESDATTRSLPASDETHSDVPRK